MTELALPTLKPLVSRLLAAVTVITALGLTYLFLELISDDGRRQRSYRSNLIWHATQIERSGWELLDRLGQHQRGLIDDAALKVSFELFWSWIDQLGKGQLGETIMGLDPIPATRDQASDWLRDFEPGLDRLDSARPQWYQRAEQRLRRLLVDLHEVAIAGVHFEQAETRRRREWFQGFYAKAVTLFFAVMLSGGLLLMLSLRGQRQLGALSKSLEASVHTRTREAVRLRNLLANIVDAMPSALIAVDAGGRVIQWNRGAEKITGHAARFMLGRTLATLPPPLAAEATRVEAVIADGRPLPPERLDWQDQVENRRHALEISVYPLSKNARGGAVIRLDNIDERLRLEEVMIQSEKMLSVGGLAAGMAHEINNPLAGILQNAQILRARLFDDSPTNRTVADRCGSNLYAIRNYHQQRQIPEMIDAVIDSGQRAATVVSNMLSFSRKDTSKSRRQPCDLGALLDQTLDIARNDYHAAGRYDFGRVQVLRDYRDDVPPIVCAAGEIQQVYFNLLKNCAQAMLGDAAARSGCGEGPLLKLRIYRSGDVARVEIEDNGPGMSETVRKRVFEPFFTTKDVGQGSGLGLSVSYFIINDVHGGTLRAESAPGRGTTFVIELPLEQACAA